MSLYTEPIRQNPPTDGRGQSLIKDIIATIAPVLAASPGEWFLIGHRSTHNGIGTYKVRIDLIVPGVEVIGRKNPDPDAPDSERVLIFARAPRVST